MPVFRGDASEVYALANDLSQVGAKSVPAVRSGMTAAGKVVTNAWRNNAIRTSGEHGRYYPDSIDSELVFDLGGVSVDIGPNEGKKQGKLGKPLEFGGRRSPAHLDGFKAVEANHATVERALDQALYPLFP